MAEFRSYAQPGQFRQPVKVPNKAKAKRVRDKEMVGELKDQNVALYNRDQEFKQAMIRKLELEKKSRDAAEQGRRESVEAERKQRVANANLAANFAEQEAKANNATWQALAELVPSIAGDIKTAVDKRKEFDAEQADNALEKSGLTPDEKKEAFQRILTQDEYASGTQAWLVKLRETGGINWHQYNAMMKRSGGYGLGFQRWDVRQKAGSFHTWMSVNSGKGFGENGLTINDILTSTELANNSERGVLLQEIFSAFRSESGLSDYNKSFRDEVLKGTLQQEFNSLTNIANKTMLKQSEINGTDEDQKTLKANTQGRALQQLYDSSVQKDSHNAHFKLKVDARHFADLVSKGIISDQEDIDYFLNLQVTNGKKVGKLRDMFPGLANPILDAQTDRIIGNNRGKRARNNAEDLARK